MQLDTIHRLVLKVLSANGAEPVEADPEGGRSSNALTELLKLDADLESAGLSTVEAALETLIEEGLVNKKGRGQRKWHLIQITDAGMAALETVSTGSGDPAGSPSGNGVGQSGTSPAGDSSSGGEPATIIGQIKARMAEIMRLIEEALGDATAELEAVAAERDAALARLEKAREVLDPAPASAD